MLAWRWVAGLVMVLAYAGAPAQSRLQVQVLDADGTPVDDAVVSLHAVPGSGVEAVAASPVADAVIEQVRGEFNPRLLVVTTGTAVRFPNLDRIRHHVYSFSPSKVFELPLYSGEAHEPVVFDEPGVVTLGCNIHDWMLGHVVVLDTPFHARSDETGSATVEAPPGRWQLQVWHARLSMPASPLHGEVLLEMDGTTRTGVELELSAPVPRRSAQSGNGGSR